MHRYIFVFTEKYILIYVLIVKSCMGTINANSGGVTSEEGEYRGD